MLTLRSSCHCLVFGFGFGFGFGLALHSLACFVTAWFGAAMILIQAWL
jgi:hypothetical protein